MMVNTTTTTTTRARHAFMHAHRDPCMMHPPSVTLRHNMIIPQASSHSSSYDDTRKPSRLILGTMTFGNDSPKGAALSSNLGTRSETTIRRTCHHGTSANQATTLSGPSSTHEQAAHRLMAVAYHECNIQRLDTAEMYPSPCAPHNSGETERIIGRFLRENPSCEMQITTKVTGPASMPWIRNGPTGLSVDDICEAIDGSLARLQTDHVHTLLLHWPDRYVPSLFGYAVASSDGEPTTHQGYVDTNDYGVNTPVEEQVHVLAKLVAAGKTKYVGLSNETAYGITAFDAVAPPEASIAVVSNAYSLLNRTVATHGVLEACKRCGVLHHGYSPLANGRLGDGKEDIADRDDDVILDPEDVARYDIERKPNAKRALAAYARLARESGMRLPQMALRFALSRGACDSVVIGPRDEHELRELCRWHDEGALPADVLLEIDRVNDRYPSPCP